MKVLVACEESQTVCKAFRERGHEAYSCDIKPCSGGNAMAEQWGSLVKQEGKKMDAEIEEIKQKIHDKWQEMHDLEEKLIELKKKCSHKFGHFGQCEKCGEFDH